MTDMILYKGENIRSASSRLSSIDISLLKDEIASPGEEFKNNISRLRLVKELDKNQYANAKRNLPFFVCGAFNPPYRRMENFSHIDTFVIDIDHLSEKGYNIENVKSKLSQDPRVVLVFASPSGDGLKVLFRLKDRCYDSGEFSVFYKSFASSFARQNNFIQIVDSRTSDVTRACFLSYDENVYYNPEAEAVDLKNFIDTDDPFAAFSQKRMVEQELREIDAEKENEETDEHSISDEALDHIRLILASKKEKQRIEREIYVPNEINIVIGSLGEMLHSQGIEMTDTTDIQYGKKLNLSLGTKQAEVNLFYGKRGFTAVCSPKRGTDGEFSRLVTDLIGCSVDEIYQQCRAN